MRTSPIIFISAGLLIVALIALGVFFFMHKNTSTAPTNQDTQNVFPNDAATIPSTQIKTTSGTSIEVRDVRAYPDTASIGDGNYVVGTNSTKAAYQIIFFQPDQSYLISLLREPLGEARKTAEDDLLSRLGITKADACKLPIRVSTPVAVSDTLGGRELGLSFCPGSVAF